MSLADEIKTVRDLFRVAHRRGIPAEELISELRTLPQDPQD